MRATKEELEVFESAHLGPPDFVIQESANKAITLHDDCPWIVARMLQWMYTSKYDVYAVTTSVDTPGTNLAKLTQQDTNSPNSLQSGIVESARQEDEIHVLVYELADKYDIQGLMTAASRLLQEFVLRQPALVWRVFDHLELDTLHKDPVLCSWLISAAMEKTDDVPTMFRDITDFFDDDTSLIQVAQKCLLDAYYAQTKKLEKSRAHIRELATAMNQAHNVLTMVGHGSKGPRFKFSVISPERRVNTATQILDATRTRTSIIAADIGNV